MSVKVIEVEIMFKDEEGVTIGYLLELVFVGGAHVAKKYVSEKKVIRVTLFSKRNQTQHKSAMVFIGPPSVSERRELKNKRAEPGFTDVRYAATKEQIEELKKLKK